MLNKQFYNLILYNLLTIGSVILILSSSLIFFNNNESFNIEKILIIGSNLTKEKSINNQFSYLKNKSILFSDKQEIRNKLISNQFISDAEVSLLLPNTIIFNIKEITPISLLRIKGKDFLIDNNENGSYCSAIISSNISVPNMKIKGLTSKNMVFSHPSYDLIKGIHRTNLELFHLINSISSDEIKINISLKNNSYIVFDSIDYMNQLKYLTSFFNSVNEIKKQDFEYIKFIGSNIVIKGMS